MSDLNDRFDKLARRGTPRGGDAVLAAARSDVDEGEAGLRSVDAPAPSDRSGGAITVIGTEAARSTGPRRHFGSGVAAAGVAAMLFVGTLAIAAFLGGGGGSDSPEGAVRQLAAAVSNEDPIAAADVLAPEEVRSLSQTVDRTAHRAQEMELARSATAPLAGLDLSVDDLSLSTEPLADGYAKVIVNGGQISADTDRGKFAPLIQDAVVRDDPASDGSSGAAGPSRADLSTLAKSLELPTFVVAVQRGDRWYVSAAYTTLEYIREANQLPAADFGSGMRAAATLGADSPDAAVTDAMRALEHSDWQRLIALAPPDEIPAYDYRAALTKLGEDETTGFTVDTLNTTSTVTGDTAKVAISAAGTTDSGKWSLDGGCLRLPRDNDLVTASVGFGGRNECGFPPIAYLVYYGARPDAAKSAQVTVVRKDGRWFVSPVGTVLDLVDQYVSRLTRRQIYTMFHGEGRLPVDGALTLGRPVAPGPADEGSYVYSFVGHRGQTLLGQVSSPAERRALPAGVVHVYAPDGHLLQDSSSLFFGNGLELTADGTYKFAVQPYWEGQTFTIWNEADAPDSVKNAYGPSSEGCTLEPDGSETCTSSGSVSNTGSGFSSFDGSSSSGFVEAPGTSPTTATTVPGG